MFGSPPAGPVHTSGTLPDPPARAAKEQAEPDRVEAIATGSQAGASGCAMADGKRTILPDLRELMRLARGAVCDFDLDVVLEGVVAAARHVSSTGYVPLGVLDRSRRERERFVTAGVDEVTRRRIYAFPRRGGVIGEVIANHVPLRMAELDTHRGSYGFAGEHPPDADCLGRPGDDRGGADRGLVSDRAGWRGGVQRARRGRPFSCERGSRGWRSTTLARIRA